MTLDKGDSFADVQTRGIFTRQIKCVRRNVDSQELGLGKTRGKREDDHSAAGANVEHPRFGRPGEVAKIFHQLLRLRPGNKRAFVGEENMVTKFNRAEEVLQRLTSGSAPNEVAKWGELRFRKRTLKLKIKLDPFLA